MALKRAHGSNTILLWADFLLLFNSHAYVKSPLLCDLTIEFLKYYTSLGI